MKILTFADLLRKIYFLPNKNRRVTIGFYLVSYDIYPHKHATLRRNKGEILNKAAPVKLCFFHVLNGFLVAMFYSDRLPICRKNRLLPIGILSLLKPSSDSYPGDFINKSYFINMPWQSHEMMI
jgi:hypothetical protein